MSGLVWMLTSILGVGAYAPAAWTPASATQTRPAKGRFLVASRDLPDPNFAHAVVLLLASDDTGAMGVVVNRRTDLRLAKLLPEVPGLARRRDVAWVGGPVLLNALIVLVRDAKPPAPAEAVVGDVHVLGGPDAIGRAVAAGIPRPRLRGYVGHAGWGPGQLDDEVRHGDWLVMNGDAAMVFAEDPDTVWSTLVERGSGEWTRSYPSSRCVSGARCSVASPCGQAPAHAWCEHDRHALAPEPSRAYSLRASVSLP